VAWCHFIEASPARKAGVVRLWPDGRATSEFVMVVRTIRFGEIVACETGKGVERLQN